MRWIDRLHDMSAAEAAALLEKTHPGCAPGLPPQVAIVGATHLGVGVASDCAACGVSVAGIHDDAPARQGTRIAGCVVRATRHLDEFPREMPVILATHRLLGLTQRLHARGFLHVWPFALLSLRWPKLFRAHPFYDGLHADLLANADRLSRLDSDLADDASRATLDAVVGFRLSLDVGLLEPVIRGQAYFPPDILSIDDDETYIDAGAYTGDTIMAFLAASGGKYHRIAAFEPSPGSHTALAERFDAKPGIRCVRACLHSEEALLRFDGTNSRDASINAHNGDICQATSIDNLPEAPTASLIKLNIEGAEEEALRGARQTLARNAPKLAVAAYHRPRDLWRLPELLLAMQPAYRLYLRQHDGGIIETVLYASPPQATSQARHRQPPSPAEKTGKK